MPERVNTTSSQIAKLMKLMKIIRDVSPFGNIPEPPPPPPITSAARRLAALYSITCKELQEKHYNTYRGQPTPGNRNEI